MVSAARSPVAQEYLYLGGEDARNATGAMEGTSLRKHERKVAVRRLKPSDYPAVNRVQKQVFQDIPPWTEREFLSQLRTFPAGQLGVELDGELVERSPPASSSRATSPPRCTISTASPTRG